MALKIKRRGKIWHYQGTVAGRRLRGTTGTEDKTLAQRVAAEVEAKAWRSHLDGPGASLMFSQAAIAYRGAGGESRFLEPIEDYWKDTLVSKITGEAIRLWAKRHYTGLSNATLNRQGIVPTQAIINYAAELGWCSPLKVKRFKESAKTKTPATREWVNAFANQANEDGLRHLAALALFMFGTGARRGEACSLVWGDIDLFNKTATINQTKIDERREAHLPPPVIAALANIPSNRNPEDQVFNYASGESVGQVWNNVIIRAGILKLSPHCCRHGFATTMLQAGIDPKTVAVRGGWKDVGTVMKFYAHAMEDPTVTDAVFDTPVTQAPDDKSVSIGKQRGKQV